MEEIILKGANGGFSGKSGSVTSSSWLSISYIKGLSKQSSKAAIQTQVEQLQKFALIVSFLAPIKSLLEGSFNSMDTTRLAKKSAPGDYSGRTFLSAN